MAKQKRKAPELMEKKSKKQKKERTAITEVELMEKKSKKQKKERTAITEVRLHEQKASPEGAAASQVPDAGPELSPEERRVLERKLKKERKKEEKKRLREVGLATVQAPPPAKPSGAELALDYLQGWAQKDASWRFQKTRQTWLLLHMYDRDKVPDEHFPTLLAYLEGLKGQARELTIQKAEAQMQELDASKDAALLEKAGRLRQVLQLLS